MPPYTSGMTLSSPFLQKAWGPGQSMLGFIHLTCMPDCNSSQGEAFCMATIVREEAASLFSWLGLQKTCWWPHFIHKRRKEVINSKWFICVDKMIWCCSLLTEWSGQNYILLIKLWRNAIHRPHDVRGWGKMHLSTEYFFSELSVVSEDSNNLMFTVTVISTLSSFYSFNHLVLCLDTFLSV